MDIDLLSKMVKELILDNDRVVLPGIGCFVAEIVPASFSDKGYTINPPYRRLSFRGKPSEGTLLVDYYAESNNLDRNIAERVVSEFLAELKEVLHMRKTVVFPDLGRLRATRENNVFFVADENLDIYPSGFGLEPVSLKNHVETKEEVAAAVGDLADILVSDSQLESALAGHGDVVEPQPVDAGDSLETGIINPAVDAGRKTEDEVSTGAGTSEIGVQDNNEILENADKQDNTDVLKDDEAPKAVESLKTAEILKTGEVAEASEAPWIAEVAGASETIDAESAEVKEIDEAKDTDEIPEATKATEIEEVQEAKEVPESDVVPVVPEVNEAKAKGAESAVTSETDDVQDSSDAQEDVAEVSTTSGETVGQVAQQGNTDNAQAALESEKLSAGHVVSDSNGRKNVRIWKKVLLVIACLVAAVVAFLLIFVLLSHIAPDFVDSLLYSKEELEVLHYNF